MKTEDPKTSVRLECNDFDKAIRFFKNCIDAHWDIIGDVEIILIQNVGHKENEVSPMYRLIKNY